MKLFFPYKQVITFFLLLIIWSSGLSKMKAQTSSTQPCDCYQRLEQLSTYYSSQQEHEKSLEAFRYALSLVEVVKPYGYYKMATLFAANGECLMAKEYLSMAISKGHDLTYIPYDENLPNCLSTTGEGWETFLARLKIANKNTTTNLDVEYLKALHDIRGSDQTIRRLIKVPAETYTQLDSINFYRLKKLIEEKGYPDYQTHGFEDTQVANLIFIHASRYSEKMYKEIMDLMEGARANCNMRGSQIAQIRDSRMGSVLKSEQILGTWNMYRAEEFKPIAQPELVDSLRFEYNLLRLKEQATRENRQLPANYRLFPYPKDYFCGYEFD